MWTLIPMVHYWFKTSRLVRVKFLSYWSNHAIIDSKKMEHLENANWSCLENANWSCTPVYLLYSWWGCYARNTEKLFCWCLCFANDCAIGFAKLKSFWLLHTARMVVAIDQTVPIYCKVIVRFKLCSCLGGATFLRAEIPPPENHTILYCLLVFFSCEHVGTTNTKRAQSFQLAPYWVLLGTGLLGRGLVMPAEARARPAMFATPQSTFGAGGFFSLTKYILIPRYLSNNFRGTRPTE